MQNTQPIPYRLIPILIVLTFAVYFNSLGNGFVSDDTFIIVDNPWIKDPAHLGDIFSNYMGGFAPQGFQASTYRPMVYVLYMVEYALFGLKPLGWHIVNVGLHAANAVLVFMLASTLLSGYLPDGAEGERAGEAARRGSRGSRGWLFALPPFAAAVLFAVHPVNSETVSWISCGAELWYTLLSLAAFYLHVRADGAHGADAAGVVKRNVLPAALFFIAILFKETAVFFITLVIAYDIIKYGPRVSKTRLSGYIPYAAAFGAYALLRLSVLGNMTPAESLNPQLSGAQFLLNTFTLFIKGLGMLVFPWGNHPFQLFKPVLSIAEPMAFVSVTVTLLGLALVYIFRKRVHYLYYVALAAVVTPILPVLMAPLMSYFTFADRYLYFPSVGFSLLGALLLRRAAAKAPAVSVTTGAKAALVAFAALALVYSVTSAGRNPRWKDNLTLSRASLKGAPDNYFALYEEAVALSKRGFRKEAIPNYLETIRIIYSSPNPDWGILLRARISLAVAYYKNGLTLEAVRVYEGLERDYAEDPWVLYDLGSSYLEMSDYDSAILLYGKALKSFENPKQIKQTHMNMGYAYLKKGLLDEAYSSYSEALKLSPGDPEALKNMNIVKRMMRR
jgi:tetratricopeptide (TPR) repeat protein